MSVKQESSRVYTSSQIAEEIEKKYGGKVDSIEVKMHNSRDVQRFLQKIERAHQQAGKSAKKFK